MLAGRWPLSVTDSGVAWGLKPYDLAIYGQARSVGETIPVVWSLLCPVARPPALAKRPAVAAVWGNRRAGGPLEIAARNWSTCPAGTSDRRGSSHRWAVASAHARPGSPDGSTAAVARTMAFPHRDDGKGSDDDQDRAMALGQERDRGARLLRRSIRSAGSGTSRGRQRRRRRGPTLDRRSRLLDPNRRRLQSGSAQRSVCPHDPDR